MAEVKNKWREHLTPDEATEVAALEAQIAALTQPVKPAYRALKVIRSRATQRAIRERAG
jgi:hypothetical protein